MLSTELTTFTKMKICPIAGIKIAKEGRLITLLNYKLNIHKLPNTFNLTKVVIFCQIWSHLAPGQKKSILKCNFFPRKDFSINPEQNQVLGHRRNWKGLQFSSWDAGDDDDAILIMSQLNPSFKLLSPLHEAIQI